MKQKNNTGSITKNKGESQQSQQKGAQSVSNKNSGMHSKDESGGAAKNTTKKQGNSV